MTTAGIDADVLRYRIGYAAEYMMHYDKETDREFKGIKAYKTFLKEQGRELGDKDDTFSTREVLEHPRKCIAHLNSEIRYICNRTDCQEPLLYLTGKGNFREQVATIKPYKGNRPDRKPKHYALLTRHLLEYWGAHVIDGMEADDALAILQSTYPDTIICTIDKDLLQVPGHHFNWVTDTFYDISEEEGLRRLYMQILTGDSVDNIPGIPKVGPAKAQKALEGAATEAEMYNVALDMYTAAYGELGKAVLIQNARLVFMLRHEGDIWTPPL